MHFIEWSHLICTHLVGPELTPEPLAGAHSMGSIYIGLMGLRIQAEIDNQQQLMGQTLAQSNKVE